jgi:transcriptional regulator with XRE-family HTH domain
MSGVSAPDRINSRSSPMGEVGRNVVSNIERLRQARNLSFRGLSERLGALGRPILPAVLHRLSQGKRRVDADDLVAFAAALGVTPADLLLPPDAASDPAAESHPAMREARNLAGRVGETLASPGDPVSARRLDRALTRVRVEVEELLEESASRAVKAG